MAKKRPNRLINEKSPYLLQHAYNPVDWYPWCEEAFEKARREDKPVFVSSGYSACHWCHVMEEESFNDPEVASLMNETFVSIKIDREERPDLDNVLMAVSQLMTGTGGWPLNVIMTPDKKPFFAETYIPKETGFGRVGMIALVEGIRTMWRERREELLRSAEGAVSALKEVSALGPGEAPDRSVMDEAFVDLLGRFDRENGGFGAAPKFPVPHYIFFLLSYWRRTGNADALAMVEKTLRKMRFGGIYDQVGFGFHRYSTDERWIVPHFEKMLYDQALLTIAYTEAYQATKKGFYRDTAREILSYVLRDMTSPEGGFYAAEDADSEGREGAFYLWKAEEIRKVLGADADLVMEVFNVEEEGNFRDEALGMRTGKNILYLGASIEDLALRTGVRADVLEAEVESARQRLFACREGRVHPARDDKILTDWNGLMIAACARAGAAFGVGAYTDAALRAAGFIFENMVTASGLRHRFRDGEAALDANLDDYAFLIWGLIELYEATFDANCLKRALDLNSILLDRFWDEADGGFFFTPRDGERLIIRQKEGRDGAMPSGNSVAMLNLLRLSGITGDTAFMDRAYSIARLFSSAVRRSPAAFIHLLTALDFALGPSFNLVIAGDSKSEDTREMLKALRSEFIPDMTVVFKPEDEGCSFLSSVAAVDQYRSIEGKATAYLCTGGSCGPPVTDKERLVEMLRRPEMVRR